MSETRAASEWGVLLLAHGAPDKLEDVPEFLLKVRGGHPLPPAAVEEITRRYALIGGGSPLRARTEQQAQALAALLGMPVYVGMRNWHPFISVAVERIAAEGVGRVVAVCLAPQNSRTSVGLYRRHLEEAVARIKPELEVVFIENWHEQPLLIRAFAERLRAALARARAAGGEVPVVLTAHSVPERTIDAGDPYDQQVRDTAARVAAAAGCADWKLAYQSQGMTAEPWLAPTVESVLDGLARAGKQHVVLAPIGFLCDHVEILYDVDIVFRDYAAARGIALWRTESLNDSPLLVEAMATLVLEAIRARAAAAS